MPMNKEDYKEYLRVLLERIESCAHATIPSTGMEYPKQSRELSLVKTKLDEAVMWLEYHIKTLDY
jgi:hypothetical protein